MTRKLVASAISVLLLLAFLSTTVLAQTAGASPTRGVQERPSGRGMPALDQAAKDGKYLFVFFHKTEDEQTQSMRGLFDAAMRKVTDKAQAIVINVADAKEAQIVSKFDARRVPMPFVFAIAPNGAITGGFPLKFTEANLLDAFVSPSTAGCMKALQAGKLVLLCVHNDETQFGDETLKAAVHLLPPGWRYPSPSRSSPWTRRTRPRPRPWRG